MNQRAKEELRSPSRGLGKLGWALLSVACSSEPELPGNASDVATSARALKNGVQSFAQVDAAGHVVPGSIYSSADGAVGTTRTAVGRYTVTFWGIAPSLPVQPAQGGTVQVVAVGDSNVRCTLASNWTYPLISVAVDVACRTPGGGFADSGFYIQYARKGGSPGSGAYAVVASGGGIPAATSWNSTGSANSATHGGVGVYFVFLGGGLEFQKGSIQVTAIGTSVHCHPGLRDYIAGEIVTVSCFNNAGAPADARFAINYAATNGVAAHGVGAFAHVKSTGEVDSLYTHNTCAAGTSFGSREELGKYVLSQTLLGSAPVAIQVSAFTGAATHCKVGSVEVDAAGTVTVRPACYSATGAPVDASYVETLATRFFTGEFGGCSG